MFIVGSPFFYLTVFFIGLLFVLLRKKRSIAFKVVFVNIIIASAIITIFDSVAIMMFVKTDDFRVQNNFYHHGLKPMVNGITSWKSDKNSQYQIFTNDLTFVDSSNRIVPLKKKGKRVLFMGDSFTEGVGFPWDKTMAGILSKKFEDQGTELLNAGAISYSPKIYYLKTKYLIEKGLKFDDIFVFIDVSDIIDEVVYDYFIPKKLTESEKILEPVINFFTKSSFIYRNYRIRYIVDQKNRYHERSDYWGGLDEFYKLKPKWTYDNKADKLYGKKGIKLAREHMTKLYELCKKHNIKMHITVWPWKEHLKEDNGYKQLEIWKKFSEKKDIDFMELFSLFETIPKDKIDEYFIPQDIHWSEKGNRFVAEYMWKMINYKEGASDESATKN